MGNIRAFLLGLLTLIAVSCNGLFGVDSKVGKPVQFGIVQSPKTRTSYSQDYDGRIDWNEGDKVAIYMDWDETRSGYGYAGYPREKGIYEVHPGSKYHPDYGQCSYGTITYSSGERLRWKGDFSGNDGKASEYPHAFWSVYPYNTQLSSDGRFMFSLPADQGNLNVGGLGLVAYEWDVYSNSNGDHVELQYWPMFTTLCVTIDNKANLPTENGLRLSSDQYRIVGSYSVDARALYGGVSDDNSNNSFSVSSPLSDDGKATFFIIPRDYEEDKLYFSLGDKTMKIPKPLQPGFKYNIKITTKEVEVEPGFSSFVNGVILAEAHKQGSPFYHPGWQFGYVDGEQKIFWNNPNNNNNWEPVPDEFLWEIINGLVDLDVEGTWEIGYVITPDDLNIFPNLRTVNLKGWFQNVEINNPNITELNIESTQLNNLHIHGCNSLTTFHVENNNNFKSIVVEDCEILEYFTLTGPSGEGVKMRCENCPVLEWFSLTGGETWNFPFHKDIINCPLFSHYDVPGCIEN